MPGVNSQQDAALRASWGVGAMRYREFMTNVILIGQATAFLWFLSQIALYGLVSIGEPSLAVLILESALFIGIIAFAVANIVKGVKRRSHDKGRL